MGWKTPMRRSLPALTRLTRRPFRMKGADGFGTLMAVLKDVAATGRSAVSGRHREALAEIAALYRIT